MMENLVFVKLGGSLITDKRQEGVALTSVIRRLAEELRAALAAAPDLRVVLGHGSGSFGHWEAHKYQTRSGVTSPEQWAGFARVSAAVLRLNRIVVAQFIRAGVPVLSLQPAASALTEAGRITALDVTPVRHALDHGLAPLVFGDVAFDTCWGGTILSTEDIFVHLAGILQPRRVVLLGNAPGVINDAREVIPQITPQTYAQVAPFLRGSVYTDVTGGMADKVHQMLALVQQIPGLDVWILSGQRAGYLKQALLDPVGLVGTCITETGL